MTILIDEPLWPAHDILWAHLISDHSLSELHAFAERAGIPSRAFDSDHYDVPDFRHAELIALGAQKVTMRQLVERLRDSGLRVTQRQKSALEAQRLLP